MHFAKLPAGVYRGEGVRGRGEGAGGGTTAPSSHSRVGKKIPALGVPFEVSRKNTQKDTSKSFPKVSQNEIKILKHRFKSGSRDRSRFECQKCSILGLPLTLSGGFSPRRAPSFHFSPLVPKSLQNGGQKLSKWRPNALKNLSGEGLKKVLKKQVVFSPLWGTLEE